MELKRPDFSDEVLSIYNKIENSNPSFLKKAKRTLLVEAKDKSFVKNGLENLYSFDAFLYDKFDECWNFSIFECDDTIIIKFAIETILAYFNKNYGYIDNDDLKRDIRSSILLKKRDLRKDLLSKTNKFKKNYSLEKIRPWVEDHEKLILTDFALFDYLSYKKQVTFTLKSLEYLVCLSANCDGSINSPKNILYFPMAKFVTSYPLVEISDQNKNLYDFYYKIVDPADPNHVYKIIVGTAPALKEYKIDAGTGTLVINNVTKNMLTTMKNIAPNRDDGEICTLIYNLNNYNFNEKGAIDFNVDDIVNKLVSEDNKFKNQHKALLRKKIVTTINKMSVIKVTEYYENQKGERTIPDFYKSFIFTEAYWIDENGKRLEYSDIEKKDKSSLYARVKLADNAKEAFAKQLHNKVLEKDYLKIKDEVARHILFFLQEERVKARNYDYRAIISLLDFKKICLPYDKVSDQHFRIPLEKAFVDLKENNIIVSEFFKTSSGYMFDFLPLSERESELYGL